MKRFKKFRDKKGLIIYDPLVARMIVLVLSFGLFRLATQSLIEETYQKQVERIALFFSTDPSTMGWMLTALCFSLLAGFMVLFKILFFPKIKKRLS